MKILCKFYPGNINKFVNYNILGYDAKALESIIRSTDPNFNIMDHKEIKFIYSTSNECMMYVDANTDVNTMDNLSCINMLSFNLHGIERSIIIDDNKLITAILNILACSNNKSEVYQAIKDTLYVDINDVTEAMLEIIFQILRNAELIDNDYKLTKCGEIVSAALIGLNVEEV